MFETIRRLFNEGKVDLVKLRAAVSKGFITAEQFKVISNINY